MPLNGEELLRQKQFEKEREHYSRPTLEQLEISRLEEQLNVTRSLNIQLENIVDKQTDKLDRINGHIQKYVTGKVKEGITLDNVIHTVGWKR